MAATALAILADGFEEIEAITPIDILRRGGVEVTTAGLEMPSAMGAHGIELICDNTLETVRDEAYSAVILPGGMPGSEHLAESDLVEAICQAHAKRGAIVAAICAAPALALSRFGLLTGRKATCYPSAHEELPADCTYLADRDVVIDENIITSRGAGTAFAFGLTLLSQLTDPATASSLAERMVYPWEPFPS
ncbi:MAG: DJ-1 family glyoxalase III [Planctomycetota bacterium]|jgi:4-methyl-5(b-hydroxyethyl)-thiazole monophosphate biosynthesis